MTDHPSKPPVTPKDAAALILLRDPHDPRVFLVKRARTLAFMAGYFAFPGGQRDPADSDVPILNGDGSDDEMRVVAVRELFEESGVLLARGVENLPAGKLSALRRELVADQASFKDLLAREGLALDANLLLEAPRWVTPEHSPRRYNTRFYAAWLPDGQETEVIPGELEKGEWLRPGEALQGWIDGDCIIVTPIVFALKALAEGVHDFTGRMRMVPQEERD
ncbi:MAG: NUDIX domain-containing protein, partial [Blastocatellia bacterium]|nr:NUDIX domain-containing protein [Blastocatellia bacterium]